MSLSAQQLREIRESLDSQFHGGRKGWEKAVADGDYPTTEEMAQAALGLMQSDDRNERVLALRFIAQHPTDETAAAILAGLRDPAPRVRKVALACCGEFMDRPEIVARVAEMRTDPDEKPKIRGGAAGRLMGSVSTASGPPPLALDIVKELMGQQDYRRGILSRLVHAAELTPEVKTLLEDFVRDGSKEEAVVATRALCGWRVAHIGEFGRREDDPEAIRHIEQTYDRAHGRVFYWVPRKGSPVGP